MAKPTPNHRKDKQLRKYRVSIMLNEQEMKVLNKYCDRYVVHNRSKLIRETLMRNILKRFDEDNPTLFD